MTAPAFDPTDKQYQLKEEFPPDKASTWKLPMEQDGWIKAHDSLRKDISILIQAFEACAGRGPIKQWEADIIKDVLGFHHTFIHEHHTNEDDVMGPFLKQRFLYPDKYEADHHEIHATLARLTEICNGLKEGSQVKDLVELMKTYQAMLLPHFKHEEEFSLPLLRAYFTPEEFDPIMEEIMKNSDDFLFGSFISCTGEAEFKAFMKAEGIPSFVWYVKFRGCVKLYDKVFTKPTQGLITGVEPIDEATCPCPCVII